MEDLLNLLEMGGYGAFVWPAYGLAALVMAGFTVTTLRGLRGLQRTLGQLEATTPRRRRSHVAGGEPECSGPC